MPANFLAFIFASITEFGTCKTAHAVQSMYDAGALAESDAIEALQYCSMHHLGGRVFTLK